jgi:hypothetical protein
MPIQMICKVVLTVAVRLANEQLAAINALGRGQSLKAIPVITPSAPSGPTFNRVRSWPALPTLRPETGLQYCVQGLRHKVIGRHGCVHGLLRQ